MGRLAAFDIEIASEIPEGQFNWQELGRLGIACAAIASGDTDDVCFWPGVPRLSAVDCRGLVRKLQALAHGGFKILTWNGCGFDFRVLAEESELPVECAHLALDHVDLMMIVTFTKGWFLSLEKALLGAGLEGKLHNVRLNDGTVIEDMNGAKAPGLWDAGEVDAVLEYLREDVVRLLGLAEHILNTGRISWISNAGNPQSVYVPRLLTVRECFSIPEPDTSWMTDPPTRESFISWMPHELRAGLLGPFPDSVTSHPMPLVTEEIASIPKTVLGMEEYLLVSESSPRRMGKISAISLGQAQRFAREATKYWGTVDIYVLSQTGWAWIDKVYPDGFAT